jgi:hypothetical protein
MPLRAQSGNSGLAPDASGVSLARAQRMPPLSIATEDA